MGGRDAGTRGVADAVAARWPLVGREDLLTVIANAFSDPRWGGVLLTGPPGAGKTRVVRAASLELSATGVVADRVMASQATREIPLGAFAPLLPPFDERGDSHVLAWAAAALRTRARGARLLLAVDDAHLLDDTSAALVHQLVATRAAFVIATLRDRTTPSDALVTLWKDSLAVRLEVSPLSLDDVSTVLSTALDGAVEQATARRLHASSQGNPLFLRELVAAGLDEGSLREHDDAVWRWRGPIGGGGRLPEVVGARLANLAPDRRQALEILAFGEPLGIDLYERLVSIQVVDELERQQLVAVARDGRREEARLAHPLYGEVLRAHTLPAMESAITRQLADLIDEHGRRRRDDLLRVATWRLAGGGPIEHEVLLDAARLAESAFDFALAERLASRAVEVGAEAEGRLVLGSVYRGQGRALDAERVWSELSGEGADDEELRVRVAYARTLNLFFGLGRVDEAMQVLERARTATHRPDLREELDAERAILHVYRGEVAETIERAAPLAAHASSVDARLDAAMGLAPALALAGRFDEATDVVDEMFPIAFGHPLGGAEIAGALLGARFLAFTLSGDVEAAATVAEATYAMAVEAGSQNGAAVFATGLGQARLAQGRVADAVASLREAAALLREHDRNRYLPWCLGELAGALVLHGDVSAARAALDAADEARTPGIRLFETRLELARAWVLAAEGDEAAARSVALATADWAAGVGQRAAAVLAYHDVCRLGDAATAFDRLVSFDRLVGALPEALVDRVAASAVGDAPGLDKAARRLGDLGLLLLAAEASADASRAYRTGGEQGLAFASAVRADAYLARCPGARPITGVAQETERLSEREREVAVLAALGLPSRGIADRLYVSVRTVDNHLHRVYLKLGVANRQELALVLGDLVEGGERPLTTGVAQ